MPVIPDHLLALPADDRLRHAGRAAVAVIGLWLTRAAAARRAAAGSCASRWSRLVLPFAANTFGWIFTEMGRQPWVVFGLLRTADGVSPAVGALGR